jgi:hypothetical protein
MESNYIVSDQDLVELAMRLAQATAPKPAEPDSVAAEAKSETGDTPDTPQQNAILPQSLQAPPVKVGLSATIPAKERKTADELATMILANLHETGCPKRGVKVTVYGSNPWNSWLSFGSEAGPVPNKVDLQGFCEIISERLKRLYDVAS